MAAFGHYHPNYDPKKLLDAVCEQHGWLPGSVRFYPGTPSILHDPKWHAYWANRLLAMRRSGILVTARDLRYREEIVTNADGSTASAFTPQEKGIDVRLALDVVRMARQGQFDVAVIFSQDQDLAEVAVEVKDIARTSGRWLKVVSAFPSGPEATSKRGIDGTDWVLMDRAFYDACLDPRDYRPKMAGG